MTKKVLFIEDEKEFAQIVRSYLNKSSFRVDHVSSAFKALKKIKKDRFDLVILDLGLPDDDGLRVCQAIRQKKFYRF